MCFGVSIHPHTATTAWGATSRALLPIPVAIAGCSPPNPSISPLPDEEIPSCKEAAAETTSSEEEQEPGFLPLATTFGQSRHGESPTDGRALRRSSRGSFTRGSLEDLLSLDPEAYQSSMWLGTEDGWCVPSEEGPRLRLPPGF